PRVVLRARGHCLARTQGPSRRPRAGSPAERRAGVRGSDGPFCWCTLEGGYVSGRARQRERLPLSAFPPEADKKQTSRYVRLVPEADIGQIMRSTGSDET